MARVHARRRRRSSRIRCRSTATDSLVRHATSERRLGIASAHGGDVTWIPTVGNVSGVQWTATEPIVYQEVRPTARRARSRRVRRPPSAHHLAGSRRQWWSPTDRDSSLIVSPDGQSLAFVSDRTGWIHVYVIPIDATAESRRAVDVGQLRRGLGQLVARRQAYRVSPQRRRQSDGTFRRRSWTSPRGKTRAVVTARGVSFDPLFSPDGTQLVYHRTDVHNSLDFYVAAGQARYPCG